jgi:hypothetical protein
MAEVPLDFYLDEAQSNVMWEPVALNFGVNDLFKGMCFRFLDTATRDGLPFRVRVPEALASVTSAAIKVISSATVTTGNRFRVEVDYRAIAPSAESLDPSTAQESVAVNQAPPGTARNSLQTSLTLTAGNLAPGDVLQGMLFRDGAQASPNDDDVASNWYVFEAYLVVS